MKIIAFSDIHTDLHAVEKIRSQADGADVLVGAGDFCNMRRGLQPVIDAIAEIDKLTVLVHGNAESEDELRAAAAQYDHLRVLHAGTVTIDNVTLLGLGGAIPETPFGDWSVDHSEKQAKSWLEPHTNADILVSTRHPRDTATRTPPANRSAPSPSPSGSRSTSPATASAATSTPPGRTGATPGRHA